MDTDMESTEETEEDVNESLLDDDKQWSSNSDSDGEGSSSSYDDFESSSDSEESGDEVSYFYVFVLFSVYLIIMVKLI